MKENLNMSILLDEEADKDLIRKLVRASLDDLVANNFKGGIPYEEALRKINEKIRKYEEEHNIKKRKNRRCL